MSRKKLFNYMVVAYSDKKMDGFHCIHKGDWRKCFDYDITRKEANGIILDIFNSVTGHNVKRWNDAVRMNGKNGLEVEKTYYPRRFDDEGYTRGFTYNGVCYFVREFWFAQDKGAEEYARRCYRLDGKKK